MSQTKEGGRKTRENMIKRYGSEEAWKQVMRERASMGGKASNTGGFYKNPEKARAAGKLGGRARQGYRKATV